MSDSTLCELLSHAATALDLTDAASVRNSVLRSLQVQLISRLVAAGRMSDQTLCELLSHAATAVDLTTALSACLIHACHYPFFSFLRS